MTDEDFVLEDQRRAGDGARRVWIEGLNRPQLLTGRRAQRDQSTVGGADVDVAVPMSDASVRTACDAHAVRIGQQCVDGVGIVLPAQRAGTSIDGIDDAEATGEVQHAVDRERRRLEADLIRQFERPLQAELADGLRADLPQRAEALLRVGAAITSQLPDSVGVPRRMRDRGCKTTSNRRHHRHRELPGRGCRARVRIVWRISYPGFVVLERML